MLDGASGGMCPMSTCTSIFFCLIQIFSLSNAPPNSHVTHKLHKFFSFSFLNR